MGDSDGGAAELFCHFIVASTRNAQFSVISYRQWCSTGDLVLCHASCTFQRISALVILAWLTFLPGKRKLSKPPKEKLRNQNSSIEGVSISRWSIPIKTSWCRYSALDQKHPNHCMVRLQFPKLSLQFFFGMRSFPAIRNGQFRRIYCSRDAEPCSKFSGIQHCRKIGLTSRKFIPVQYFKPFSLAAR